MGVPIGRYWDTSVRNTTTSSARWECHATPVTAADSNLELLAQLLDAGLGEPCEVFARSAAGRVGQHRRHIGCGSLPALFLCLLTRPA